MLSNIQFILPLLIILKTLGCYYAKNHNTFPPNFLFGTASSAYQIEGAWNVSGKSESIWDYVTHNIPEKIIDRSNGDIACDSYHKVDEDIKNLKRLNVDFYSFSLSWPRLLPYGDESYINPDGVRYYNELIDKLIDNNIMPVVTLYQFDMPQLLQYGGGWVNPLNVRDFKEYATIAFRLFGDRVKDWVTINEPFSICGLSYEYNIFAPYHHMPGTAAYVCAHTLLLAHANAYQVYKNQFFKEQQGTVGWGISSPWFLPATKSKKDIEAANRYLQFQIDWFLKPIFSEEGGYPQIMHDRIDAFSKHQNFRQNTSRMVKFTEEEKKLVQNSADFLALSYFTSFLVSDADGPPDMSPSYNNDVGAKISLDSSWNNTGISTTKVHPEGMRHLLNYIKDNYNNPAVYILANGYAGFENETTEDDERIWYHKAHLNEVLKAIHEDDCNVQGYSVWSFMDSFEWGAGYTLPFGLFKVDFNDPARTRVPKKSAMEISRIFKTHKLN